MCFRPFDRPLITPLTYSAFYQRLRDRDAQLTHGHRLAKYRRDYNGIAAGGTRPRHAHSRPEPASSGDDMLDEYYRTFNVR